MFWAELSFAAPIFIADHIIAFLTGLGSLKDGTLKNFFEYVCKKAEITVPDGVTTIGEIAFADSNLCKITLPETVKSIEGSAFLSNFYLCEINIPEPLHLFFLPFEE